MWKLFSWEKEREREGDGFIHHKWSFGWMPLIPSNCLKTELYSVLHSPDLNFSLYPSVIHGVFSAAQTSCVCITNMSFVLNVVLLTSWQVKCRWKLCAEEQNHGVFSTFWSPDWIEFDIKYCKCFDNRWIYQLFPRLNDLSFEL